MNKAFEIVFSDDYLVVVNKIAKVVILPSFKNEKYTLTSLLEEGIGQNVYPCHRLDRETTGLIIYAKSKEIQNKISEQFRRKEIFKKYIAFARGKLKKKKGIIEGYIIDREGKKFGEKPKKAKTAFKVLREFKDFSMIELIALTGRTNQLRIQLASIGNPILGERKYAQGKDFKIRFRRVALHASSISFIHPQSKKRLNFNIGIAEDMRIFLNNRVNFPI